MLSQRCGPTSEVCVSYLAYVFRPKIDGVYGIKMLTIVLKWRTLVVLGQQMYILQYNFKAWTFEEKVMMETKEVV